MDTNVDNSEIINLLMKCYDKIMLLNIYIDSEDNELKENYIKTIEKHNRNILKNNFIDAGFDLYCPENIEYDKENKENYIKVDLKVKCSAEIITDSWKKYNTGYYLYSRSSIYKTPLRLANSVGIIDSGYRNNIMAVFDKIGNEPYTIEKYTRLVQICSPSLCPIYIFVVDKEEFFSETTERGFNGFGSSGIGIEYLKLDDVSSISFVDDVEITNVENILNEYQDEDETNNFYDCSYSYLKKINKFDFEEQLQQLQQLEEVEQLEELQEIQELEEVEQL